MWIEMSGTWLDMEVEAPDNYVFCFAGETLARLGFVIHYVDNVESQIILWFLRCIKYFHYLNREGLLIVLSVLIL